MSAPLVSVIVCTRDRAPLLEACLRSLVADRCETTREILVVDNGSTDGTAAVVETIAAATPQESIRRVLEPEPGHARARNRGVAEARGELLLFTDDDAVVEPGWTDALAAAFSDPATGAAGGRILPGWPRTPPAWLDGPQAELLTLIDHGPDARPFAAHEHPLGASFAVRAELARGFDPPFDPSLGHGPDGRLAHEEVHLLNRIRETHVLSYRPDAVIVHQVEEARMTLPYMRRAFFQLGVGLGRRERIEGAQPLPLAVRMVRASRTFAGALRAQRRNDRAQRSGPETWDELRGYMWAGKHFEMLFGRFQRFTKWAVARLPPSTGATS